MNALIVEDNAAYRQSLRHLLAGRFPSMQIAEAPDGKDALRHGLSRRFDLVFVDIRLPDVNGLALTKTIKSMFVNAMVCVITSYDILEYREAAFKNGADHFMVKGESTEKEIVELVESWLRTRFISLIIVNDALYRKQLKLLLSIHWPVMLVAEAEDAEGGLGHAVSLNPDLVLLDLGLAGQGVVDMVSKIRDGCPHALLIGMTDESMPAVGASASKSGIDHCVPLSPIGHTELVAILNAMPPKPTRH
jgi:DNA-binding NarL/FixJ family response regulator